MGQEERSTELMRWVLLFLETQESFEVFFVFCPPRGLLHHDEIIKGGIAMDRKGSRSNDNKLNFMSV
jgi:hypothetical protein